MIKNILKLDGVKTLEKRELVKVNGGTKGTCGYHYITFDENGRHQHNGVYGISKTEAKSEFNKHGGNWCCDGCSGASWIGFVSGGFHFVLDRTMNGAQ